MCKKKGPAETRRKVAKTSSVLISEATGKTSAYVVGKVEPL